MTQMMKVPTALAVAALFTAPAFAQGQDQEQSQEEFLKQAMQGDLAEISMGELAQEQGQSEEVREFGRQLVSDHSSSLEKARQVAREQGIEIPDAPAPEEQQIHDRLSQLSGEEFDREFARQMVEDHEKHIDLFEEHDDGDSQAAEHAEETLPVLEEHLQVAESLEAGPRG